MPTRIYVDEITRLTQHVAVHAMSHITGGGYYENLPRMIAERPLGIALDLSAVTVPDIFSF